MAVMAEQRRHFRVPVELRADLELENGRVAAAVPDACAGGIGVVVPRECLPIDRPMGGLSSSRNVRLTLHLDGQDLELEGQLAWVKTARNGDAVAAGITFTAVEEGTSRFLKRWLLGALAAVHTAAEDVLAGRWETAADSLSGAGFKNPSREVVLATLRRASSHLMARTVA
jgi:hypothetical protein